MSFVEVDGEQIQILERYVIYKFNNKKYRFLDLVYGSKRIVAVVEAIENPSIVLVFNSDKFAAKAVEVMEDHGNV